MSALEWPLALAAAAVLGLLIGSFLNVCIFRLPRDLSVVQPRSFCPACGGRVAWYDNIPVLSFVFLRRRCRNCGEAISWRYPVVELSTALLFAGSVWRFGATPQAARCCVLQAILVALFWTDAEENILPDEFTIGGMLMGLIFACFVPVLGPAGLLGPQLPLRAQWVLNAVGAALVFTLPLWGLAEVYGRLRNVDALGLGDVKLIACLGVFLGFQSTLLALLLGTVSGAIFGIAYVIATRRDWRTTTLPFGSFLCAGAAVSAFI